MNLIKIDKEICIGCGLCVKDCFPKNILLKDGKAVVTSKCMECGHCIAVCPQNAVVMDGYDMSEVLESSLDSASLEPELLLKAIKGRRAIRHFKQKRIEDQKLENIIEAGRYTPTGSNRQELSYIVVREELPQLTKMAMESLKEIAQKMLLEPGVATIMKVYARRWIAMCDNYSPELDGLDDLFFHAPAVLLVVGDSVIDAGLAASNMELMTFAEGLGMFYSGFFVRSANGNAQIKEFLEIPEGREVLACLVLGYPDVRYYRTVPRKPAKVVYK